MQVNVYKDNVLWIRDRNTDNDRGRDDSLPLGEDFSPEASYVCAINDFTIPSGAFITSIYFNFHLNSVREGSLSLYGSKTFDFGNSFKGCLHDISDGISLSDFGSVITGWNSIKLNTKDIKDFTSFMLVPTGSDSRMWIDTEDSSNIPYMTVVYDYPPTPNPLQPSNLQPRDISIPRTQINRFSWDFNIGFSGDHQVSFELLYSIDGITWTTVTGTTSSYYNFLANTFENGSYKWKVRVKNASYNWSTYSNQETFNVFGNPDPVAIGDISITDARPNISWETDVDVLYHQVKVKNGTDTIEDSGKLYGNKKVYRVKELLENRRNYNVEVVIENQENLQSEVSSVSYTTDLNIPSSDNDFIVSVDLDGVANLKMINSNDIVKNEIYRKTEGETDYFLIGECGKNEIYKDYELLNETKYYYKIKCFNLDGSYMTTPFKNCFCKFSNSQLINISTNEIAKMKWITSKDTSYHTDQKTLNFANRQHSVVEFGILEEEDMNINVEVKTDALNQLTAMFQGKQVLLFKDSRGKLKTVIISSFNTSDQIRKKIYTVSMSLKKVGEEYERNKY